MRTINIDENHEQLLKEPRLLEYRDDVDYPKWKKEVEKKFIELLGIDEIKKNDCELKIEIEEVVHQDGYTRYRYVFDSEKDCPVPCYLLIPDGDKKYPVCICMQGHTTGFHNSIGIVKYEEDSAYMKKSGCFALDAVKNGYAALCIEQRGMGERTTPRNDRGRALTCGCYFTSLTAMILGRTIIGERVWDISKGIDSLKFFDKLDLEDITLMGQSGGGTATYYAACYDKRIKYVVPSCAVCSFEGSIANIWHCTCNYIPGIAKYFDMGELAALIAPRKLLIPAGGQDYIFLIEGTKKVYSVIEKIYEREGAKDNCKLLIFENEGHKFMSKEVYEEMLKMRE